MESNKILLISHELTSTGAPLLLLELAKYLYKNNWKIDVWVIFDFGNNDNIIYNEFKEISNIRFLHVKLCQDDVDFATKNYDVIICNTIVSLYFAVNLNALLWCHEYEITMIDDLNKVPVIALTDKHKQLLNDNGVNTVIDIPVHGIINSSMNIPQVKYPKVKILVIGSFIPLKNQLGALEIVRPYKNVELTMVGKFIDYFTGDDSYYQQVKANMGDIDCKLIDVQPHEKVLEMIEQCNIVLIPSECESYSMVAIEALERGKTVLLTDNTCNDFEEYLEIPCNSRIMPVNEMQEYLGKLISSELYLRAERIRKYNFEERWYKILKDELEYKKSLTQ